MPPLIAKHQTTMDQCWLCKLWVKKRKDGRTGLGDHKQYCKGRNFYNKEGYCKELEEALKRPITDEETIEAKNIFLSMRYTDPATSEQATPAKKERHEPSVEEMRMMDKELVIAEVMTTRAERDEALSGKRRKRSAPEGGSCRSFH